MTAQDRAKHSLEKTIRVLRDYPLLKGLTDEEFRLAIKNLRPETLTRGKPLISPGEANTNLYVIRRGRLGLRRLQGLRAEAAATMLGPGHVANLKSFLTGARNDFSLEAEDDTDLVALDRGEFQELIQARPEIARKLRMPSDVQTALRERTTNSWMVDGEKIEIYEQRHWWSFVSKLIPLALPLIGTIAIFVSFPWLSPLLALVPLAGMALWVGWFYLDWRNDFYAVTNYRAIHRERVLLLRDDQEEVPLDKVQNTSVHQSTLLAQLLDYGDVGVETAGVGAAVSFHMIRQPRQVSERIISLRDQSKTLVWATERQRIRSDLRVEIKLAPKPPDKAIETPQYKAPIQLRWEALVKSIQNARNTLLPRVRLQEGDKVTFRKHWLRLLETAGPQFALFFLFFPILFSLYVFNDWFHRVIGEGFGVYAIVTLLTLGWFVWRYEDWRNDIYVLDKDRIIDIDRSPFGVFGAQRKEARYDSIQNISSSTRGTIDLLLNVGDVKIMTGGADNALVFERVYDPLSVQRELQRKIDAFKTGQQQKQVEQRRRELSEAIGIYDELRGLHGQRALEPDGLDEEGMVRY